MKVIKLLFIILIITNLAACSSIVARSQNGVGHSYIGTEESISNAGALTVATTHYFFPALLITIPISVLDIGLSIITDTVLLPVDLIADPDNENRKTSWDKLRI